MTRRVFASLASVAFTVAVIRGAQDPEPIRVSVTEVVVPVTVTDAQGRFVTGLQQNQFEILDQGFPQEIKFFSAGKDQPLVAGFLMDLSTSMQSEWKTYRELASELVRSVMDENRRFPGYLIGAGTDAELLVDTTHSPEQITEKLDKLSAGGGSALADALYLAFTSRKIVKGEPLDPRRVIVVFGSGLDTSRTHSLDEVIELAQRNSVVIYAVSTDRAGIASPDSKNLERLAKATGGRVEYPLMTVYSNTAGFMPHPENEGNRTFADGTGGYAGVRWKALSAAITAITGEIQNQYVLRYVPNTPGEDRPEHRLRVNVTLSGVTVNARPNYFTR